MPQSVPPGGITVGTAEITGRKDGKLPQLTSSSEVRGGNSEARLLVGPGRFRWEQFGVILYLTPCLCVFTELFLEVGFPRLRSAVIFG